MSWNVSREIVCARMEHCFLTCREKIGVKKKKIEAMGDLTAKERGRVSRAEQMDEIAKNIGERVSSRLR